MHPFKLHNLVVFSIFIYKVVWPSPPVPEHFITPERSPKPLSSHSPSSLPPLTSHLHSASLYLAILVISYKWNHTVFSRFIHVTTCNLFYSFLWLDNIPLGEGITICLSVYQLADIWGFFLSHF